MKKEYLEKYEEELSLLNAEEKIDRDLHLRNLAVGNLLGPLTGYSSLDKVWLKYFSEDAITEKVSDCDAYSFIYNKNKNKLDNIAITYMGKKISFREFFANVNRTANCFIKQGIEPGDVVTVALPNTPENAYIFYALVSLGAIVNIIDLRMKSTQLFSAINNADSKMLIFCDLFSDSIKEIEDKIEAKELLMVSPLDSIPIISSANNLKNIKKINGFNRNIQTWRQFYNQDKSTKMKAKYKLGNTPACILYTSGSTGEPKGVILTSNNINNLVFQYSKLGLNIKEGERFLNEIPPFLAYNILCTHMPLYLGLEIVMLPDYNPEKFADYIRKYNISHVLSGPSDWNSFLNNKKIKNADFSNFISLGSGGAKINPEIKKDVEKILSNHGCNQNILEGYGMTEMSSAICTNIPSVVNDGSVGVPFPQNIIAIFDDDGVELPYGEVGEICATGSTRMFGYLNASEEESKVVKLHKDGMYWVHSGDLGYMNENGVLFVKGRKKRVIVNHEGFKLSPYIVEDLIRALDFIEDCYVVGIDDIEHNSGSIICPNIKLKENCFLDEETITNIIIDECRKKFPEKYNFSKIRIVENFPIKGAGKIDYIKLESDSNINISNNSSVTKKLIKK